MYSQFYTFCLVALLLVACREKTKKSLNKNQNTHHKTYAGSTGRINSLLIVIENKYWQGDIGKALKKILSKPIYGLPQEEYPFDVTQIAHRFFGKMFRTHRNILNLQIGDTASFQNQRNVYAKPQQIVNIKAINSKQMITILKQYQDNIIQTFQNSDIKILQNKNLRKAYPKNYFKTLKNLNIHLQIPNFFNLVEDTGTFLWLRQHLSGGIAQGDGRSALLIYSIPIPKNKKYLKEKIIQMRDSIGQRYLKGSLKNSYMITEKAFIPKLYQSKHRGKTCYITKGKWELYNDFMAGPFLNYIVEDIPNKRWIVIEGFVYAPSINKRDYMFELQAVIQTLNIKNTITL